jgi:hypothetical protein
MAAMRVFFIYALYHYTSRMPGVEAFCPSLCSATFFPHVFFVFPSYFSLLFQSIFLSLSSILFSLVCLCIFLSFLSFHYVFVYIPRFFFYFHSSYCVLCSVSPVLSVTLLLYALEKKVLLNYCQWHEVVQLVEALRYKPEGLGFDIASGMFH